MGYYSTNRYWHNYMCKTAMERFRDSVIKHNLEKAAHGHMMCVAFDNLEQKSTAPGGTLKMSSGEVWMPDCEEYRTIIGGDDNKAKAALVQRFCRNLPGNVVFVSCDAKVVRKGK